MQWPGQSRSSSSNLSSPPDSSPSTPLHDAISDNVPELLEHSIIDLADVERVADGTAGEGILVKLFPAKRKSMRSGGASNRKLWIVATPNIDSSMVDKLGGAQKAKGRVTQLARAGATSKRRGKAKATRTGAGSRKGQRLRAKGEGRNKMTREDRQEDLGLSSDTSDEEDEAEEDDDQGEEEEEEEEEAEDNENDEDTDKHKAAEQATEEHNTLEEDEAEQDTEEQDDEEGSRVYEEARAREGDKGQCRDDETEEDQDKDEEDEEEREKGEVEGEKEAEQQEEEEEDAGVELGKHSDIKEQESADNDEPEEEDEDDEKAEENRENYVKVREDREFTTERVAASNHDGAWRSWKVRDMQDKPEEEESIDRGEEDRIPEEENGNGEERRKRHLEKSEAFGCSTPEDRPNKRVKSDGGENEDGAATDDLAKRTLSPETTPRPETSSPTSNTASPGSARAVVRQASVVPGLQDTENAVWDAAKRDSVISSLSLEQQTKLVLTALSLGSEEGIEELRRFVCNLRKDSKRGSDSLTSNSNLIAPNPGLRATFASNDLIAQSDRLSHLSVLYRRLDVLESQETRFTIAKRANLAALAQYRESLVPKGVGRNRARDANLKLFRAIFPDHSAVERPEDKVTHPTASQDWFRLRNRLNEGRAWLEVRDLFGGNGAFLALPPQCVPDSYVSRITAKNFGPLLGLLDVAWRALDDGARRTMDALVRLALTGQPLPGAALALERPEAGIIAASAGLSPMLAGWSEFDGTTRRSGDPAIAHLAEQNVEDGTNTQEVVQTTTAATKGKEAVADVEPSMRKGTLLSVDDGLLENVDFEERLSQQI